MVFLCPHRTFWKSTIASGFPSIMISGTVRLLMIYNLYLAPFLTSRIIEFLIFLHGVFFLVARVTVTLVSSPCASLILSGVILKSLFLRVFTLRKKTYFHVLFSNLKSKLFKKKGDTN